MFRFFTTILSFCILTTLAAPLTAQNRTFTDMRGKKITVPAQVNRVIGTGGAVDAWVLLLGCPEKLVATSPAVQGNPWYIKAYPGIKKLPAVINSNDTSTEVLLSLKIDAALELSAVGLVNSAEKAGIPTLVFERDNPDQLMQGILIAGEVLGKSEAARAKEFCDYYRANIKRITDKTQLIPREKRPKVFYLSGKNTSEGSGSIVTSWIDMGGGFNVTTLTGVTNSTSQTVSVENVLAWDPDVIVVMSPELKTFLASDPQWKNLAAVKNQKVYVMPKGIYQWGVRAAEEALQVLWAGKIIHPELFPDLDLVKETKLFHQRFYHFDMDDADAQRMLAGLGPR